MAQITGDWLPAVRAEFAKPYYRELYTFLQKEYRSGTIYPPADQEAELYTRLRTRFSMRCT